MKNASTSTRALTIGIDLGDRFSHFCYLDASGELLEEGRLRTSPEAFAERFAKMRHAKFVLEAGTHSPWVTEILKEAGHETIVANPSKLRMIYTSDKKCDRVDAEQLARVGRMDARLLSPIQHRTQQTRADLAMMRARDCLVQSRTQLVNHVRGALKSFGVRLKACSTASFAKTACEQTPPEHLLALGPTLEMIQSLTSSIRDYERKLERVAKERYPVTQVLRQVNGVGALTSLCFVLTLEDPKRFRDSRTVGAYLGLRPKRDQSGVRNPELRITKAGDRDLRRLLVQSAQYILGPFGQDCYLRRFGLRMAGKGSQVAKRKAVIAVARKLAVLLHSLWRSGEEYDPLRNLGASLDTKIESAS